MPWTTAYRMRFTNVEGAEVSVIIYDTTSLIGPPSGYTELTGADDPFHLFITDNDEDVFSPIKALQAELKFLSTSSVNLSTFFTDDDNRWQVEAYVDSTLYFIGYLVLDDVDEDFLDSSTGNVITLIASDNIGKLKDFTLVDSDGDNPRGYYTLAQYVAMALAGTGLELNINICHNVREENSPTQVLYQSAYLQSKTFERDINVSVSGYETLEIILGEDAFITQWLGEWWIVRLDEVQSGAGVKNVFDSSGTYVSSSAVDYTKVFGPSENIYFSELNTFVKPKQPVKEQKLTFPFNYPIEIIDNIDFSQGAWLSPISLGSLAAAYAIDHWTLQRVSGSNEINAYIKRTYKDTNWTYEDTRYVVMTSGATAQHWIKSNPIPMHEGDRLTLSVDRKLTSNYTGSGTITAFYAQVRLYGTDGTFWTCGNAISAAPDPAGTWVLTNSSFSSNARFLSVQYNRNQIDEREWLSGSIETLDLPVDGDIYVCLYSSNELGSGVETHFSNLSLQYQPIILGDHSKYAGYYHRITQAINSKKSRDREVRISDGEKKLFKGALRRQSGSDYPLIENVYDGLQFGSTVPSATYLHPFGYNQAWAVWNKNNRPFRIFDFNVQGLDSTNSLPSLLHRITINETTSHTTNKYFMLLHYDMDMKLCTMSGVMCEIDDTTIANVYDDEHEHKYIMEK